MKLYTEEQVRQIFNEAQHLRDCNEPLYHMFEDLLVDNSIIPIELPSDEDIKHCIGSVNYTEYDNGFIQGIKWVKEQILNQNK